MTMVFGGIDLPIFEILFVVSVLLLAGLFVMILGIFYVLNELRELKKIMKKEEDNIKEFKRGIEEFKKTDEKKDSTDDLKKYIKDNLSKGLKWEDIKKSLLSSGWQEKDIETIYSSIK
jgi:ABC-type bacteriocin/lantibiotic exporter with double-glycine peptidase domain